MKACSIYQKILQEHSTKPALSIEDKELLFSGIRTVVLSVEVLMNCSNWETLTELFNSLLRQSALFTDFHIVGIMDELMVGWMTTRLGLNTGKIFYLWSRRWRVMTPLRWLLFTRQSTSWLCYGIKRSRFVWTSLNLHSFKPFFSYILFFNYIISNA